MLLGGDYGGEGMMKLRWPALKLIQILSSKLPCNEN
jgi:hypothetical protein